MSLGAFHAAGYAPVPVRHGRAAMPPTFACRHDDPRFDDCAVGLWTYQRHVAVGEGLRAFKLAEERASACTWIAGVRWRSHDKRLNRELAEAVERIAGPGPTRIDGTESLRVFRVDAPFAVERFEPQYLPKEDFRSVIYTPHSFEILSSLGSWRSMSPVLIVSGGTWRGGSLPDTKRDELPALTGDQASTIIAEVETIFRNKGAAPWV